LILTGDNRPRLAGRKLAIGVRGCALSVTGHGEASLTDAERIPIGKTGTNPPDGRM